MYKRSSWKVPIIVGLYSNLNFLNISLKNSQISNFMKVHLVVAESLHGDRWAGVRTDGHHEADGHFLQFFEHT